MRRKDKLLTVLVCEIEVCVFVSHSSSLTFDLRYFKYVAGPAFQTVSFITFRIGLH